MALGDLMDLTPKELMSKVMLEEKVFETWYSGRTVLLGDGKRAAGMVVEETMCSLETFSPKQSLQLHLIFGRSSFSLLPCSCPQDQSLWRTRLAINY